LKLDFDLLGVIITPIVFLSHLKIVSMKNSELQQLITQLDAVYSEMPNTHFEMQERDRSAFLISREIEKIKDPKAYKENLNPWEGHELRF
jgi:hypothetical protein